ncbi:MAG: methionine adenosyltransferase domain-containing protein, partial [Elusimicrobiota bacterium]|nr:methionine adenosyltransferase domain-containing protein [Elusimicrobiota bacterium]
MIDSLGTGVADAKLAKAVRKIFPLTPRGIIEMLELHLPIYQKTAAYGHFGRNEFRWEKTDKAAELKSVVR